MSQTTIIENSFQYISTVINKNKKMI